MVSPTPWKSGILLRKQKFVGENFWKEDTWKTDEGVGGIVCEGEISDVETSDFPTGGLAVWFIMN
jgi:hypothetical protein